MTILIIKRYTREYIRENPDKLFIFGDNYARRGLGGQAKEARGEPNAIGICTKKAPTYEPQDFLTDEEYVQNITNIFEDFQPVLATLQRGAIIVWPEDGIGTGIARLAENAPRTLQFINTIIEGLKEVYGWQVIEPTKGNGHENQPSPCD